MYEYTYLLLPTAINPSPKTIPKQTADKISHPMTMSTSPPAPRLPGHRRLEAMRSRFLKWFSHALCIVHE